jgi:hypothetical protein
MEVDTTFEHIAATCVTTTWDTILTYLVINCLVHTVVPRVYLFVIGTKILKPSHSSLPPSPPLQYFRQLRKGLETAISQCLQPTERKLLENSISRNWQSHYPLRRKCHPPPQSKRPGIPQSIITYALTQCDRLLSLYVCTVHCYIQLHLASRGHFFIKTIAVNDIFHLYCCIASVPFSLILST